MHGIKLGYDARRRNRNIGTKWHGRGQDNRLVVPTQWHPTLRSFFERVRNPRHLRRTVHHRTITFLVEETRPECVHACTVDDIVRVLEALPPDDISGIDLVVLRQPKRKEEVLRPAWGRWVHYAQIGEHSGTAVFLESQAISAHIVWEKSLGPEDRKELQRLRIDGHRLVSTKRQFLLHSTLEAVRNTQLYRTLIHEIGHNVDYGRDPGRFDSKPLREREAFANRYATEWDSALRTQGAIPFARIAHPDQILSSGLRVADFIPSTADCAVESTARADHANSC